MPNRIIKESLCDSEKIASLSDFEFRLWVGLIVNADDAGRGDARPAIIKGHIFALRERVTVKDIDAALRTLAAAGCVSLYTVGGKPYYAFPSWAKHQRIRDCKPKFPGIDESDNLPQSAADCRNPPQTAALIQSESNPNPNPNPNISAEPEPVSAPPVISFPLNTGEFYPIFPDDVNQWQRLYPAVDVIQELKKMLGWLESNPKKRKTSRGIRSFVTNWLSRQQDRGGAAAAHQSNTANPFAELMKGGDCLE